MKERCLWNGITAPRSSLLLRCGLLHDRGKSYGLIHCVVSWHWHLPTSLPCYPCQRLGWAAGPVGCMADRWAAWATNWAETCVQLTCLKKYSRLQQTSGRVCGKGLTSRQKSWTKTYRCPFDLHNYVRKCTKISSRTISELSKLQFFVRGFRIEDVVLKLRSWGFTDAVFWCRCSTSSTVLSRYVESLFAFTREL